MFLYFDPCIAETHDVFLSKRKSTSLQGIYRILLQYFLIDAGTSLQTTSALLIPSHPRSPVPSHLKIKYLQQSAWSCMSMSTGMDINSTKKYQARFMFTYTA